MDKIIKIKTKERLSLKRLEPGIHKFYISVPSTPLGVPWQVPCIVLKGSKPGPTLGITAALHGDELNGTNTIFKVFDKIKSEKKFAGTLVAIPIVNVAGYMLNQREYIDGKDLNRSMPGNKTPKTPSDLFNHFFTQKIVSLFDYHLDLHTASTGRVNSLYVRVDLEDEKCKSLALMQNPQIIVSKSDESGTLREWANSVGIPSITIEIGNPNIFQKSLIDDALEGVLNTLKHLKMIPGKGKSYEQEIIMCSHSDWLNTSKGGLLELKTKLTNICEEGQVLAVIYDVFGEQVEEVRAPRKGVVIGMRTKANCSAGDRIVHIGNIIT